ncbi:MAG TPA: helical backbone metal receptor [Polyangiaceae bacterium]|nr:helical backbone metal receptor [Polyangiaceae bacterium]
MTARGSAADVAGVLARAFALVLVLALAVAPCAAGCSRGQAAASRPAGGAARVVSLAPSMTEALFAIGAGDRVVGRSRFCDYPPEARALPVVGDLEPDLEAIVALHPDLVVGLNGLSSDRLAEQLAARGVASWFVDTSSLAAIDSAIVELGERCGHAQQARALTGSLDARERAIERAVAGEPRPRVLLVVSLEPVVAAGPRSFADELIAHAGGQNVVTAGGPWPTLGFETIARLDPDVVLDATAVGSDQPSRITPGAAGWAGVGAVRRGRVVAVRDERVLRAGPRIADGLAALARVLHPGAPVP